jgi:carboxypeptidase Q
MRDRAKLTVFLLLMTATGGAAGAPLERATLDAAAALRDAALKSPEAYALVTSLTSEVGPRLAGTAGDRAAVAWAERELGRLGLANVRRMPVVVPRWVRGTAELAIDDDLGRSFAAAALGGSIGTTDDGIRAEVVALHDIEELRRTDPRRLAGRIVYLSRRMERTRDGAGYGATVPNRTAGPSVAASKGAVALVIRSVGTDDSRFPHTGSISYNIESPRIPAVAISNADADALERLLAPGKPLRLRLRVTARDLPRVQSANVIAEVPGTDRRNEIVLLAAHLDSWDLGEGALDDGAGVAIVMAAARLIADVQPKPRRTVRVVLFANEEFGLSGSNAYAASLGEQMARHAVSLEADSGDGPVYELQSRVAPEQLPLVRQIQRVLAPLGVTLGNNEATGGADTRALLRGGVPVLAPKLDASRYFDHHHTANDTLDKVDRQRLNQTLAAFAVSAYLAARADEDFVRVSTAPATP